MTNINALNQFHLVGRLARDPKIFQNRDGSVSIAATLAVEYMARDGVKVNFIDIRAFKNAKAARTNHFWKNVAKGDGVAVSGHIASSSYTGRDGQPVYKQELIVDSATFGVGTPRARQQLRQQAAQPAAQVGPAPVAPSAARAEQLALFDPEAALEQIDDEYPEDLNWEEMTDDQRRDLAYEEAARAAMLADWEENL